MSLLVCSPRFHLTCLTPYQVHNLTEAQQWLAQYLEVTWSDKSLNYAVLLRERVANLNETRLSVLSLNVRIWDNIKRLFDPSWITTYAMMGGIVLLIIILFKYLEQHISKRHSINKVTLQVLMALKNSGCTPLPSK